MPSAAVQHNGTSAFVYVVQPDNTVAVQQVTTLTSNDQDTAVQGVNAGVNLATSGFDRLENGVAGDGARRVRTRRPGSTRHASGNAGHEPFAAIYSPSGGDGAADGGAVSGGRSGVTFSFRFRRFRKWITRPSRC